LELLKALAMPFQLGSLLFVAASSLVLGLMLALASGQALMLVLMLFVIWLLLVWQTNYALRLIDDVANGVRESAAASAEMLTDPYLDSRAWVHPVIAVAAAAVHVLHPGWPLAPTLVTGVVLLPASLGACIISGHALDALRPAPMWRVVRSLGIWYAPLVLFIATCALLAVAIAQLIPNGILVVAIVQMLLLVVYAAIGGVLYERRWELGFDPRISPERVAELAEAERVARRQHVLDGLYNDLRMRKVQQGVARTQDWLCNVQRDELTRDVHAILAAGRNWQELRYYPRFLEGLLPVLVALKEPGLACTVAETGLAAMADFNLGTESEVAALIGYAMDTSRPRTATKLFENFMQRAGPSHQPGPQLAALRERLQSKA
jgi:hypothetical protein